jgi:hypothetical protein
MKVNWKKIGISSAVSGAVLLMSGCASPPRVEVSQLDEFKLECTQLEAERFVAQSARANTESFHGARINFNDILEKLLSGQELKFNYDSDNASIKLAEKGKDPVLDLTRDRKCPIAQS